MKHDILLALGSNHRADSNLQQALSLLARFVDIRRTSATLVSAAIGEGMENGVCPFTNQLLCGETLLPLDELQTRLKEAERLIGRRPGERYTIPIDLDILRYDDRMLHPDDWDRPYIRRLLEDL
ncbi:MAG: 2-amino-4-hydroxy-6-hydroxymethyldihydropteridine diphosphokinase [Prevotella sp.]